MLLILKSFKLAICCLVVFITVNATALESSFKNKKILVQGTPIEILFAPGVGDNSLLLSRKQLIDWIEKSANAVANYYQKFPVSKLNITINTRAGSRIGGQAFSGLEPMIVIRLGRNVNLTKLQKDWVLVHEMVHLAFPSVYERHHWIEEGLATYVEPIIRVRAGLMSEKEAWYWMLTGMPKGLPKYGDQGLDNTPTWGRRYWGGALFSLLADSEIRQQSNNRYGLDQALRGILKAGFSMQSNHVYPLDKILKIGDKATRTDALLSLYNKMKGKAVDVDLHAMWKRLGVRLSERRIILDENAPQATLRRILMFGK